MILLIERGNIGVSVFYGGDNYFGFGNFDFEVFWGNLVVVIL